MAVGAATENPYPQMAKDPLKLFRRKRPWAGGYRGPYHVWSNAAIGVTSVRRSHWFEVTNLAPGGGVHQDGWYYVLSGCLPLHLISGDDHLLVSGELRDVLRRHCGESVRFEPAPVRDGATGRDVKGYSDLRVPLAISKASLLHVEAEGGDAWLYMDRYLFVSEQAAAEIERAGIPGLQFAPGFSDFFGRSARK